MQQSGILICQFRRAKSQECQLILNLNWALLLFYNGVLLFYRLYFLFTVKTKWLFY